MDDIFAQSIVAYRKNKTVDVVQFRIGADWGVIYTLHPASTTALVRVGDQYRAMRAAGLRYVRRARLRRGDVVRSIAVYTELPERRQQVFDLDVGQIVQVPYLRDSVLKVLEESI